MGPILFPFGVAGEVAMLIRAAGGGRPLLYVLAVIWVAAFLPLMKNLLGQRRKHMAKLHIAGDEKATILGHHQTLLLGLENALSHVRI